MGNLEKIIAGISVGDINGIGIEVILKTFEDERMLDFCTPVIFASLKVLSVHKKYLGIKIHVNEINSFHQIQHGKVNVFNIWKKNIDVKLGEATKSGGIYAAESLEKAVKSLNKNEVDFLLTAPINKDTIQSDSFNYPGHTEFLEDKLKGNSLMILMNDDIKIGLITGHISILEIANKISPELIENKVSIMYNSLQQDFKISKPKIAVLGLNPHAGDNGLIGKEEIEIIKPTLKKIQESGKLVFGPYATDGFFGSQNYKYFDAIMAMYHDQGLAPFKTIAFGNGVNFTAGLNKIRTSPDHGTAFEIAGKGKANNSSFKEALFTGIKIFKNRRELNLPK